jgi:hypothetical protein
VSDLSSTPNSRRRFEEREWAIREALARDRAERHARRYPPKQHSLQQEDPKSVHAAAAAAAAKVQKRSQQRRASFGAPPSPTDPDATGSLGRRASTSAMNDTDFQTIASLAARYSPFRSPVTLVRRRTATNRSDADDTSLGGGDGASGFESGHGSGHQHQSRARRHRVPPPAVPVPPWQNTIKSQSPLRQQAHPRNAPPVITLPTGPARVAPRVDPLSSSKLSLSMDVSLHALPSGGGSSSTSDATSTRVGGFF